MEKEIAQKVYDELNTPIWQETINKAIYNKLGVKVNMVARYQHGRYNDDYIILEDAAGRDVNNKMRGNKLLRHLFEKAYIQINVWNFDNSYGFPVNVYYDHPNGGSNGHELLLFYIMKDNMKIRYK